MCDGVPEQVGQACQVFRVWAQTCLSGELWPRREIPAKVPLCKCLNGSNLDAGEQSTNPWLSLNRLDHNYPHLSCSVSTSVSSPFSSFLRGNVTLSQRQVCSSAWTWPDLFSFIRICTVVHLVHKLHLVRWVFHSLLVCVCVRETEISTWKTRSNVQHLLDLDCDEGGVQAPGSSSPLDKSRQRSRCAAAAVNLQTKMDTLWHPHCSCRLWRSWRVGGVSNLCHCYGACRCIRQVWKWLGPPALSTERSNYVNPSHNSLLITKFQPSCEITPTGEWSMFSVPKNLQNKGVQASCYR